MELREFEPSGHASEGPPRDHPDPTLTDRLGRRSTRTAQPFGSASAPLPAAIGGGDAIVRLAHRPTRCEAATMAKNGQNLAFTMKSKYGLEDEESAQRLAEAKGVTRDMVEGASSICARHTPGANGSWRTRTSRMSATYFSRRLERIRSENRPISTCSSRHSLAASCIRSMWMGCSSPLATFW